MIRRKSEVGKEPTGSFERCFMLGRQETKKEKVRICLKPWSDFVVAMARNQKGENAYFT